MDTFNSQSTAPKKFVTIYPEDGQWRVRVIDDGNEQIVGHTIRDHAEAFAANECMRLGIPLHS